jgi:nucleoside-diphosphate-sugar epimerase
MKVLLVHDASTMSGLLAAGLGDEQLEVDAVLTTEVDDVTLRSHCESAHAVVYVSTGWDKASAKREASQVAVLIGALNGSAKRLLYVSDSTVIGDTGDSFGNEDNPRSSTAAHPWRAGLERQVGDAVSAGIHSIIVRLAVVHGRGSGALVQRLTEHAELTHESVYVGDGLAKVSTVHVDDVVALIHAALLRGAEGSVYVAASAEVVSWQDVAAAVAQLNGAEVKQVSNVEASRADLDVATMSIASVIRDESAHRRLHWQATGPLLLVAEGGRPAHHGATGGSDEPGLEVTTEVRRPAGQVR